MNIVPLGGRFTLGPFDIELVSMAHSIPESNGLIIRTPLGTVLHTGDWKIDPTPVIGPPTDEAKLRALGDEGCLALIGDSTNAVREGRSPSEADVAKCLADLIRTAPARVAVTTFASNVARLRAVALAAANASARSSWSAGPWSRIAQVARETGYLDGIQDFRSVEIYGHLPPDKVLALCTGSQGEPRAALSRIAQDDHPDVAFSRGDRVIFSSRAIPGNEKEVMRVINGLVSQGIEVITDRTHLVHVSGHPRVEELKDMIGWVRPQILIPVHGEPLHMAEHAALARRVGVGQVVLCRDGELIRLAPGAPGKIDEVPAGRLYKDGSLLVSAEERTVADRRRLGFCRGCFDCARHQRTGRAGRRSGGDAHRHSRSRCAGTKNRGYRLRRRPRGVRVDAACPSARPRSRHRGGAARDPRRRELGVEQEAQLPRARARGVVCASRAPAGENHDRTAQSRRHRSSRYRQGGERLSPDARRRGLRTRAAAGPRRDHGLHHACPTPRSSCSSRSANASPIVKFLERNPDGGIHHVCYEVDDIRAARDKLKGQGARVLGDGEPKIGAHGKPVLFLHPKDFCGTLVEIEQA